MATSTPSRIEQDSLSQSTLYLAFELGKVAYLRAADNVSRLFPIRLRGMHQSAVSP